MSGHKPPIGKPDVDPSAPSHTRGVKQGNSPGNYEKMEGHNRDGTSTARRSTGINASHRDPIHPDSPNLSPA